MNWFLMNYFSSSLRVQFKLIQLTNNRGSKLEFESVEVQLEFIVWLARYLFEVNWAEFELCFPTGWTWVEQELWLIYAMIE